jgi:hypothetical protein
MMVVLIANMTMYEGGTSVFVTKNIGEIQEAHTWKVLGCFMVICENSLVESLKFEGITI